MNKHNVVYYYAQIIAILYFKCIIQTLDTESAVNKL